MNVKPQEAPPGGATAPRRVMFYSHDTFGLGHLRRTLTIARYLRREWPDSTQLIVTGSPVAGDMVLPDDADYVKLPSVVKTGADRYEPRSLFVEFAEISALRASLILAAARHFRPDVLLVDHAPLGLAGEVTPTLRYLRDRHPESRRVLGLRDVVDDPDRVRAAWRSHGVYEALETLYDRILVYGQPDVVDVASAYDLPPAAAAKLAYVGYLRREAEPVPDDVVLPRDGRLVVVTAGGGGDGEVLLETALEAARPRGARRSAHWLLVPGPLMAESAVSDLRRRAGRLSGLQLVPAVAGLSGVVARAGAVAAMGGYNTVCEILSFDRPAVIVPRVEPRREQMVRARALARRGLVQVLPPDRLTPERLRATIEDLLDHPDRPHAPVILDGLPRLAEELASLVGMRRGRAAPAVRG